MTLLAAITANTPDDEHSGRAAKGGEIGINGEHYEGGQFLPNSRTRAKGSNRPRTTGKRQIAPYVWEIAPSPSHFSIFDLISNARCAMRNAVWEWDGDAIKVLRTDEADYISHGFYVPLYDLIAAYNAGSRWVDTSEWALYVPNVWK